MNVQLLIDQVVRQTTVLIAQLATSGGTRAPVAHIANQVFVDLARELEGQGVSRKVSADMFGMALRAYQRKLQRLKESADQRDRSLWQMVLEHIGERGVISRGELLRRFKREEPSVMRGVLRDLVESGLVFSSGSGMSAMYRATSEEELDRMRELPGDEATDAFLWAVIYRLGPLSKKALLGLGARDETSVGASLSRLIGEGRVRVERVADGEIYSAGEFYVAPDAEHGWEAAVFDHFQALVQTICARLRGDAPHPEATGGSTYTLDVWPGHPLRDEALGTLARLRTSLGELRTRIEAHNASAGPTEEYEAVVVYAGQCVIERDRKLEREDVR